jgi:hypothetical protein
MTALDSVARVKDPPLNRGVLLGATLAFLFSANTVFIFVYNLVGITGSSLFSGGFLVACEMLIVLLTVRRVELLLADYIYGAFLLCIAASFAINGLATNPKEIAILIVSLTAYPLCRFISPTALGSAINSFALVNGCIVAIGAVATAHAIFDQWPVEHGKPFVFGTDGGATHFLIALGFLILALVTQPLTLRRSAVISALLFLPVVIFAAALVRLTFVAIVASLFVAAILSAGRQRLYIAIVAASIITAIPAGILCRMDKIQILINFMTEQTQVSLVPKSNYQSTVNKTKASHQTEIVPPSCTLDVNMKNSFAQRKALTQDALYLTPFAGAFGFGLDGFMKYSCMIGFPIHNSALQAFVEFGWIGGAALVVLVLLSLIRLLPMARQNADARFALCSLAYVAAISLAHGRTSRDILLYALLGLAAGVYETYRTSLTGPK